MQQDTVTDGQTAISAVNQQENQSGNVPGLDDQHSYGKEEDEGNSDAAHISGEAFCLSPRTEIEEREDKHAQQNDNEKRILNKSLAAVHQDKREENRYRIAGSDAIDAVHKVVDICCSHTDYQSKDGHHRIHKQIPHNNSEYEFQNMCSDFRVFLEKNYRLPEEDSSDGQESKLAVWFYKILSKRDPYEDIRYRYFDQLLGYLSTFGFEFR